MILCNRCIHAKVCSGFDICDCPNFFEIIRCKDCVFSNAKNTHCCLLDTCILKKDYCSWGERKETNECT